MSARICARRALCLEGATELSSRTRRDYRAQSICSRIDVIQLLEFEVVRILPILNTRLQRARPCYILGL